jgi:hypothetical protein
MHYLSQIIQCNIYALEVLCIFSRICLSTDQLPRTPDNLPRLLTFICLPSCCTLQGSCKCMTTGRVSSYVGDTHDNTDNTMHNHLRIKRRKTKHDCGSILTAIQLLLLLLSEQQKRKQTKVHLTHGPWYNITIARGSTLYTT